MRPDDQSPDYGSLTSLVMRMSGGKISDASHASRILFFACMIMLAASLFIFFVNSTRNSSYRPVPVTGINEEVDWPPRK